MNQLIKNMFAVIVIALLISLSPCLRTVAAGAGATVSQAYGLVTAEVTYADPNGPEILPEMVLNHMCLNVIADDSNEPAPMPEMVPSSLGLNVISEDSDDEPAEMVPTCSARAMLRQDI